MDDVTSDRPATVGSLDDLADDPSAQPATHPATHHDSFPGKKPSRPISTSHDISDDVAVEPVGHETTTKISPPSSIPTDLSPPSGPTSPEDDPNPSSTTYCTEAYPGKKLVQYALMIDAGSTGSRIHVYKFNYCHASPMLEYEVFAQTRPGLSSFKTSPKEAAGSLNDLMAEAMRVVPESLRSCTPLAVKATAGLRLLGKKQSKAILKEVEHHLKHDFPFPLVETDPVVIMDGKDEGDFPSSIPPSPFPFFVSCSPSREWQLHGSSPTVSSATG